MNIFLRTCALCALLAFTLSACDTSDPVERRRPEIQLEPQDLAAELSEDELKEAIRGFCTDILNIDIVAMEKEWRRRDQTNIIHYQVTSNEKPNLIELEIDALTGTIVFGMVHVVTREHFRDGYEKEVSEHKRKIAGKAFLPGEEKESRKRIQELTQWRSEYEKLSVEEAFEKAIPFLKYFGQSEDIEEYRFAMGSHSNLRYFWIRKQFSTNGIRNMDKYISVQISCFSGRIFTFSYKPITKTPVREKSVIAKSIALENAKEWMAKSKYAQADFITIDYEVDLDDITEIIKVPSYSFREKKLRETLKKMDSTPRYCWVIPFDIHESGFSEPGSHIVYVDQATGEVIE